MKSRRQALALVLLAAAGLGAAVQGLAEPGRDDGTRALGARQGGRILPLQALIASVEALMPGRLLDAELDDEDGAVVYELRWQLPDGRRLEIEIDARTGEWRELKGPRLETAFRRAPATVAAPGAPAR